MASTAGNHRSSSVGETAGECELSTLDATHAAPRASNEATDGHVHWARGIRNEDHEETGLERVNTQSSSHTRADRTAERIDRIAVAIFAPGPHASLAQVRSSVSLADEVLLHANAAEIEALRVRATDYRKLRPTEYHSQRKLLIFVLGMFHRKDEAIRAEPNMLCAGLSIFWNLVGFAFLRVWIEYAPARYSEYLASQGIGKSWWYAQGLEIFNILRF